MAYSNVWKFFSLFHFDVRSSVIERNRIRSGLQKDSESLGELNGVPNHIQLQEVERDFRSEKRIAKREPSRLTEKVFQFLEAHRDH